MPRGRPRKPLAYHLITGSYRPSRHGSLPKPRAHSEIDAAAALIRAECERWRCVFETGHDFFNEVELPCGTPETVFFSKVLSAWRRLGPAFMTDWQPSYNVTRAFALIAFGDPTERLRKPTEPLEVLRDRELARRKLAALPAR